MTIDSLSSSVIFLTSPSTSTCEHLSMMRSGAPFMRTVVGPPEVLCTCTWYLFLELKGMTKMLPDVRPFAC